MPAVAQAEQSRAWLTFAPTPGAVLAEQRVHLPAAGDDGVGAAQRVHPAVGRADAGELEQRWRVLLQRGRHRAGSGAATNRLRSTPRPATSASTTSPACRKVSLPCPTPPGVPVAKTSPGSSVVSRETYSICSSGL